MGKNINNLTFWKRIAKFYTPLQERSNTSLYPLIVNACLPYLSTKANGLELACGTGQFSFLFSKHVALWTATDYCDAMIKEANKRKSKDAQVLFEVQDATNLSYEDNTFDIVFIANALHVMPNPDACMKEIKRVLKKDGYAILLTFVYEGKIPALRMKLLESIGFHTYHKWNDQSYMKYCISHDFDIVDHALCKANPLPESLLILRKK